MPIQKLFDLKEKVALVTGGGRGIGRYIADGLAEAGANLVIASRNMKNNEEAAREITKMGVKCVPLKCDMGSRQEIIDLVDRAVQEFGTIDILVNNAGVTWGAPTLEYPLEKWEKIFEINVKGVWILTQTVARIMKEKGGGKIINVSSVSGLRGSQEEEHPAVAYNSSKAAINLLTMNLAVKLARYGIYVNAIALGPFKTDMMSYLDKPGMKELRGRWLNMIPLRRLGCEDDIKGVAVLLASKASDFITGAILPVDGGILAS